MQIIMEAFERACGLDGTAVRFLARIVLDGVHFWRTWHRFRHRVWLLERGFDRFGVLRRPERTSPRTRAAGIEAMDTIPSGSRSRGYT
jgi:hypothetical protein